jgi:hypothetical protein
MIVRERSPAPPHSTQGIRAELVGSDTCTAAGEIARCAAPVLAMCRKLIEAGFDPSRTLLVYRGETLCLTVRSIGEGAALTVAEGSRDTPRFRRWKPMLYREGSTRIARQERAAATLAGS